jgi:hypothetical protein
MVKVNVLTVVRFWARMSTYSNPVSRLASVVSAQEATKAVGTDALLSSPEITTSLLTYTYPSGGVSLTAGSRTDTILDTVTVFGPPASAPNKVTLIKKSAAACENGVMRS